MRRLVEPGRYLIRRDVPVRRYIGIGAVDREQPGHRAIRKRYQRIVTGDMKGSLWRAVGRIRQVKRQRRCDRLVAVEGAHGAETALAREFQACGAIRLEKGWR